MFKHSDWFFRVLMGLYNASDAMWLVARSGVMGYVVDSKKGLCARAFFRVHVSEAVGASVSSRH